MLALNKLRLAQMQAARLIVNELRLTCDIVAASVNEPNQGQTRAQQDLYEACVEKAVRRTDEFDAAVRKNAKDIEKYCKDFRLYEQQLPHGRAAPPDTWCTIDGAPHDECFRCTRRHSPIRLCSQPATTRHDLPFNHRWASPPRDPLRPGGPPLPLTVDDFIMPEPRRMAAGVEQPARAPNDLLERKPTRMELCQDDLDEGGIEYQGRQEEQNLPRWRSAYVTHPAGPPATAITQRSVHTRLTAT